ncbi:hypothetical protein BH10ACT9_BH10ACT9_29460 [soil metagenome]
MSNLDFDGQVAVITGAGRGLGREYALLLAARGARVEIAAAAEEVMRPFLDRLDPSAVAPVVAYLAHENCPVSGEIYTAGAGQVARFFVGRTCGYRRQGLTVEDVAARLDEIRDPAECTIPGGPADEMAELFTAIF